VDGLDDVDAVVHLAGQPIAARRWNQTQRQKILESRVQGTGRVAAHVAGLPRPPEVLVSASAVGYYGSRGDEELTEESAPGEGFLPRVCRAWEAAASPAQDAGVRTVWLRSGLVLAGDGGALKPQLLVFRIGLGGRLGDGSQWVSWISIDDHVGAIRWALETDGLAGPVNMTSPQPVTNATFTRTLARVLHRPAVLPVPAPVLRTVLGRDMADELILPSQRAAPVALERSGYAFRQGDLAAALGAILGR
jgi:uncharacterized protein (TIGR01777 family)